MKDVLALPQTLRMISPTSPSKPILVKRGVVVEAPSPAGVSSTMAQAYRENTKNSLEEKWLKKGAFVMAKILTRFLKLYDCE